MKIQSPLFTVMSGKLGGAVGVGLNGQKVLRSYNPNPQDPKTLPQRLQRAKMKILVNIGRQITSASKRGFINRPATWSGFNAFTSSNMDAITGANPDALTTVWANIEMSRGNLDPIVASGTIANTGLALTVPWTPNNGISGDDNDEITTIVVRQSDGIILQMEEDATRVSGTTTLNLRAGGAGTVVSIYQFAHNPVNKASSITLHRQYTLA